MGYILEKCGINDVMLKPLAKSVKETSIASLSKSRKGNVILEYLPEFHDRLAEDLESLTRERYIKNGGPYV